MMLVAFEITALRNWVVPEVIPASRRWSVLNTRDFHVWCKLHKRGFRGPPQPHTVVRDLFLAVAIDELKEAILRYVPTQIQL